MPDNTRSGALLALGLPVDSEWIDLGDGVAACSQRPPMDLPTAHEYVRVSMVRSKSRSRKKRAREEAKSPAQQSAAFVPIREVRGWRTGKRWSDLVSASRYSRDHRDGFEEMLGDIESGRVARGDVIMLWESSRGSRRQAEWASFLDLCLEQGVYLYVRTHDHLYDMSVPRDRKVMDDDGANNAYESALISMRVLRDVEAAAKDGNPHGGAAYGWRHLHDVDSGEFLERVIREDEAVNVRDLMTQLAQRIPLNQIEKDWRARGIRTRSGKPFSAAHLRTMAQAVSYIGLRVHHQGNRKSQGRLDTGGNIYKANWPAIVDAKTFFQAQDYLKDPSRKWGDGSVRPGQAKYMLSQQGDCDVCGAKLAPNLDRPTGLRTLRCGKKGCVRIVMADVDQYVSDYILTALESPEFYSSLDILPPDQTAEKLEAAKNELTEALALRDVYRERAAAGKDAPDFAAEMDRRVTARIKDAEKAIASLTGPTILDGLITPGADVRDRWAAAALPTRREIARLLLTPPLLGRLKVRRQVSGVRWCGSIEGRVYFDRTIPQSGTPDELAAAA